MAHKKQNTIIIVVFTIDKYVDKNDELQIVA